MRHGQREFESVLATELAALDTLGANRGEAGHLGPLTMKSMVLTQQDYRENVRTWVHDATAAALTIRNHLDGLVEDERRSLLALAGH